jgi:hypothetical protein
VAFHIWVLIVCHYQRWVACYSTILEIYKPFTYFCQLLDLDSINWTVFSILLVYSSMVGIVVPKSGTGLKPAQLAALAFVGSLAPLIC